MPTIDQLNQAVVSADDDLIPISQNGASRRVTRAQLLAGVQTELALGPGLLGRSSAGIGGPEPIQIGSGLTLSNGVLTGRPEFAIASLAKTGEARVTDLIAVSRAGRDLAVPLATAIAAQGVDISAQVACGPAGVARSVRDWLGDALPVEAFGAVGDGISDDTPAFARAVAYGTTIRLGPKTYRVDGQWTVSAPLVLLGIRGASTLLRMTQAGGAWISVAGPIFVARNVTFDAGAATIDSWGVSLSSACTTIDVEDCRFINNKGKRLGNGLTVQARTISAEMSKLCSIRSCEFSDNAAHGLWIQAVSGAVVTDCTASSNLGYGICVDYNDPTFKQQITQTVVQNCRCWSNARGVSIGNYNETNLEPPRWGLENPDAVAVRVSGNVCVANEEYGIAVSGRSLLIDSNLVSTGPAGQGRSGILCNARQSSVRANVIGGPGQFGIDAGGCAEVDIVNNTISGFSIGVNPGGSRSIRVSGNRLVDNARGITIFQVETDGSGSNFGISARDILIRNNSIGLENAGDIGVAVYDGAEAVVLQDNQFLANPGIGPVQVLRLYTDDVIVERNEWIGDQQLVSNAISLESNSYLVVPDLVDRSIITDRELNISGIIDESFQDRSGRITFIKVRSGGTGYSRAAIAIAGTGFGASATAYIRDGTVIGIAMTSSGAGYGPDTTSVEISGDGAGASAEAFVGSPLRSGRRIVLSPQRSLTLRRMQGRINPIDNFLGRDLVIPAGSEVTLVSAQGKWQAVSFAATA